MAAGDVILNQFDQMVTAILDKTRTNLTDQIRKKIVLLAALDSRAKVNIDGGQNLRYPLIYDYNSTIGAYSGYDLIDTTPQEGLGFARYKYGSFAGSVTISGEEVDQNSGSAAVINLLSAKIQQLNFSFEKWLADIVWGNQTTPLLKEMISLQDIVSDADPADREGQNFGGTNVNEVGLGGIPAATVNSLTETWWQSQVDPQGAGACDLTTTDGLKVLNNMLNTLTINLSNPTLELTTQENQEAYEFLCTDKVRFQSTKMGDLGFQSVAHKNAEVVFDPGCPSGEWYFLNLNHLEFVQHGTTWMKRTDFVRPYNQDAKTALVLSRGNLVTDCRRAHGKLTGIVV
jgi:hypothetical protein